MSEHARTQPHKYMCVTTISRGSTCKLPLCASLAERTPPLLPVTTNGGRQLRFMIHESVFKSISQTQKIPHDQMTVLMNVRFPIHRTHLWVSDIDWGLYSRLRVTIYRSAIMKQRKNNFLTGVDITFCVLSVTDSVRAYTF